MESSTKLSESWIAKTVQGSLKSEVLKRASLFCFYLVWYVVIYLSNLILLSFFTIIFNLSLFF